MTLGELLENVELQGDYVVCYYDEEQNLRIEVVDKTEVYGNIVLYIYPEGDTVFIEIEI